MLIFLIKNMYAQPFQSEYIFQFENYNTKLNKTWHTFLKKIQFRIASWIIGNENQEGRWNKNERQLSDNKKKFKLGVQ